MAGSTARVEPALAEAIDAFLLELRVERGLSPLTIAAYRRDLAQFAAVAGRRWRDDPQALIDFVTGLQHRGARGSTQARKSAAVRSFYAFALREGLATRDVPALVDAPKPGSYLPDVLSPEDVELILDAPPAETLIGTRDRAILELLYGCGLRVSELVGLDVDRVDLPNQQVRVIGKGDKERRVPMGDEARERLHRYRIGPRSRVDGREADAGRVRRHAWQTDEPGGGVAPGEALDRGGGRPRTGHSAHVPAQFCNPSARWRRRPARGPGPAWPC